MPLSALATVEHQLIMHCLQSREIVQLARCSRSLMHAADSPFAFRHAEPIRRPFPEPPQGSSVVRSAQLCLQHAPFIVVWTLPRTDSAAELDPAVDALIAFLEATSRAHGLDAEANWAVISQGQWKRILACSAARQIRFLALPRPLGDRNAVSADIIEALSHLPLLATLRMGDNIHRGSEGSCALLKLCELPSLTSFDSSAYYRTWPPTCLRSVARCRHLTSLGFSASNLNMDNDFCLLSPLDSCPSLPALRHLRIEWCSFRAEYLDDFFRVISRMSQLRSLTLAFFNYLSLVCKRMPTIVAKHPLPATLETICLQPTLVSEERSKQLQLISGLLTAFPRLRFVLRIEPPYSSQDHQTHLRVANGIRESFTRSSEFEGFRKAGRFRIDWQLRN